MTVSTLESEAWWESGDGWWRARRGKPMASQGSEAVARRKEKADDSLSRLGGVLGNVKLPLRLRSCVMYGCFDTDCPSCPVCHIQNRS